MKRKGRAVVDLAAVRRARARLDAIIKAHPELVQAPGHNSREAWETALRDIEERDMGRPRGPEPTETLTIRLGESVVNALDIYRDKLAGENPGFVVSRNDAMRRLLVVGLEREGVKPKAPKAKATARKG